MYRLIFLLIIITSCSHSDKKNVKTKIEFEKTNYNVGKIAYKSKGVFEFKFWNIGEKPLTIEYVSLSCACLETEWPKYKINPNDTCSIVVFKDTGRLGSFKDRIFVHYNGENSPIKLNLSGTIIYNPKTY